MLCCFIWYTKTCNTEALCLAGLSRQSFDHHSVTAHVITAGPTGMIQDPEHRRGACMLGTYLRCSRGASLAQGGRQLSGRISFRPALSVLRHLAHRHVAHRAAQFLRITVPK